MSHLKRWAATVACLIGISQPSWAAPASLTVAAASDLQYCLEDLNQAFHRAHPDMQVVTTTGSSGNFFAQIRNGAPFDVFLSADVAYPKQLISEAGAVKDSLTPYAVGRIAVWTLNPQLPIKEGLHLLANPAVKRVAIADPSHAPYGRAAKEALTNAGLWSQVQPKLVMGDNIGQTAQFIQSGNADAGIVALSLLLSPKLKEKGRYAIIPLSQYGQMLQAGVITKHGAANPAAKAYLQFLKTPSARAIFDRYGFLLPEER